MRKNMAWVLILALIWSAFPAAGTAQEDTPQELPELEVVLQEDFNDEPAGWTVHPTFTRVQRPGAEPGDYMMHIPAGSASRHLSHSLNAYEGTLTLEVEVNYAASATQIKVPDLFINGNQQGVLTSVIGNRLSVPYFNPDTGTNVRKTTPMAPNEWHNIRIQASTVTDRFSLWLNDVPFLEDVPFFNGTDAVSLSQIRFTAHTATDPEFYVDNVFVYKGEARIPVATVPLSSYLLRSVLLRADDPTLIAGNFKTEAEHSPYVANGVFMLPIGAVAAGLRADTGYDEATKTQRISRHGVDVLVTAGAAEVLVGGVPMPVDVPAVVTAGTLYVSLDAAALILDKEAIWDAASGLAILAYADVIPSGDALGMLWSEAEALLDTVPLPSADIYVDAAAAPGGDGSENAPFAALEEARAAARILIAAEATGDIRVILRGGTYRLSESFVLTDADSPQAPYTMTYMSYPGERAVVEGGTVASGWLPHGGGIYKAPLPAGSHPQTLYESGTRASIARHPDTGYLRMVKSEASPRSAFIFEPGDIPQVAKPEELQVLAWPGGPGGYINYSTFRSAVVSVDYTERLVALVRSATYELGTGSRYYMYNAPEFLNAPGEYYVNRATDELFYMPYGDLDENEVLIPADHDLIVIDGTPEAPARNIVLEGLVLHGTDLGRDLVSIANAHNITVHKSELFNSGNIGIHIKEHARQNVVDNNLIYQTGFYGVYIAGRQNTSENETYGNVVTNSYLHHVGEMNGNAAAIRVAHASYSLVSHNRIRHSPRNGIHIMGAPDPSLIGRTLDGILVTENNVNDFKVARYNTVEYNDVSEVVQDSMDTNAIGMWGAGVRNTIRRNSVHHVNLPQITLNRSHSYWFPLYLDENSNDQILDSNIAYSNQLTGDGVQAAAFHDNASKDAILTNNVFLDANYSKSVVSVNDMNTTDRRSTGLVAERNLMSGFNGYVYTFSKWTDQTVTSVDRNFMNSGDGRYLLRGNGPAQTLEEWKTYDNRNYDAHSLTGEPLFANASGDDYRLRYASPVYATGFQDIPQGEIGLQTDYAFADASEPVERLYLSAAGDDSKRAWAALPIGDSRQLEVTVRTASGYRWDVQDASVTYISSNPQVAVVDAAGEVTALARGTAEITVSYSRGGVTLAAGYEIIVDDELETLQLHEVRPVYRVQESFVPLVLAESEFGHLVRLDDAVLSASDSSVVIDGQTVTVTSPGTYTLTAASPGHPALSVSVDFIVQSEVLAGVEVTLDQAVYEVGETVAVSYTLLDSAGEEMDASEANITFTVDGEDVLELSQGQVLATGEGIGSIVVTADLEGQVRSGRVDVAVQPAGAQIPAGYTLSNYNRSGLNPSAGYAYEAAGRIHMATSGFDAWGTEDSMAFLHRELTEAEELTVEATVHVLQNPPAIEASGEIAIHAAAGVMIRAEDAASSHNVFVRYRLNGDVIMSYRNQAYPASTRVSGGEPGQPVQVRLTKNGDQYTGYYKNGLGDWIEIATITVPMGDDVLAGIGLQSGSQGNMNRAELSGLLITE
ncbi:stalk domain-containing protein [Paenibacillus daejeonensis]|uniref:stalk domain-containing protein n=1 Tax=Paenibacillus daejeonensis TaxID=135193 RepID=UPI0003617AE4|nr:stalk domain-containing protein [Paenibacillus daejeonensis]